ncbi:hypothetical protein [Actinoallomurus sp. NPDC052274]|uniref:hypothetical protein n=1 Tax=Actinoallomurus sp. NPDC052274 TaxID=3155420 RepID=UPI0034274F6E
MANTRTVALEETKEYYAGKVTLALGASKAQMQEAVDTLGLVFFARGLLIGAPAEEVLAVARRVRRMRDDAGRIGR